MIKYINKGFYVPKLGASIFGFIDGVSGVTPHKTHDGETKPASEYIL